MATQNAPPPDYSNDYPNEYAGNRMSASAPPQQPIYASSAPAPAGYTATTYPPFPAQTASQANGQPYPNMPLQASPVGRGKHPDIDLLLIPSRPHSTGRCLIPQYPQQLRVSSSRTPLKDNNRTEMRPLPAAQFLRQLHLPPVEQNDVVTGMTTGIRPRTAMPAGGETPQGLSWLAGCPIGRGTYSLSVPCFLHSVASLFVLKWSSTFPDWSFDFAFAG
jgi:hypothetical protein